MTSRRLSHRSSAAVVCFSALAIACSGGDSTQGPASPNGVGSDGPGGADSGAAGVVDAGPQVDASQNADAPVVEDACAALEVQAERRPVDIIFVIDSSSSMVHEVAQVRQNINAFAQKIANAGLDYRVVMIAEKGQEDTEMCVPEPLAGPDCASNPPYFHHADVKVSSKEHLYRILTSYDNKDPEQAWRDVVRYDSIKAFVAISDDNSYLEAEDFEKDLFVKEPVGMFGNASARRYTFHSICGWNAGTPILDDSRCDTAINNGEDFQKLSVLTGGLIDSVCKLDYSDVLDNIADGVVAKVGCEFLLPESDTGQALNHDNVLVNYFAAGTGQPDALERITDVSKCGTWANAWYYDDNAAPTTILLCPDACDKVQSDPGAKVQVLVGCAEVPPK